MASTFANIRTRRIKDVRIPRALERKGELRARANSILRGAMARDRRDAVRRLIADGKNPSAERQAEKQAREAAGKNTFELIARHYLAQLAEPMSLFSKMPRPLKF